MNLSIRRLGWVLGSAIFLFGLQYGAFAAWYWDAAAPALLLALTVTVSLSLGAGAGSLLALVVGLAADALTGWGLGMNMLVLALTAAISAGNAAKRHAGHWLTPLILGIFCYFMSRGVEIILLYLCRMSFLPGTKAFVSVALSAGLTGLASVMLHAFLYRKLCPEPEKYLRQRADYYHT